ncbi:hypothetical protein DFH08DRAFT_691535 [Mycena albidolilacea]|uniref:Fork-head domain-containing protein n=1 Tax=Mycena albidolilacea TaxID=1033008 RepID=A0AAD7ACA3_9AGAR|nr:hypothetical protein DFH08DRAFT_691535 [Mycena albidolilacea]
MALPPGAFYGPHSFPDAGNYLRIAVGIPLDLPVALESLLDPPAGARPTLPLRLLIGLAIYGSEQKSLTLQGIFDALAARFEYFREQDSAGHPSWRRSIRHALSLYSVFTKIERQEGDPGKGCYWTLNVNACADGPYDRPRKRNKRKESGDTSSDGASAFDWDESHLDRERTSSAVFFETTNMARSSAIGPTRTVGSRSRALSPVGDTTPMRTSRHRTRSRF